MRITHSSLASIIGTIVATVISLAFLAFPGQIKAQDYQLEGLGTFGGQASFGMAINDGGAMTGYFEIRKSVGVHWHGFVWADGEEWDTGSVNGTNSWMDDINNAGQAVGYSDVGPAEFHAAIWERGVIRSLGTLGGVFSRARAINDVGVAAGMSDNANGNARGCIWWPNGTTTELPTLGGSESQAMDINERNQVVGFARDFNNVGRAFFWAKGALFELPSLGDKFTKAEAINNFGVIAGWSQTADGYFHAVSWDSSYPVDLGTVGGNNSWAYDINDNGIIVGTSEDANGLLRATVWLPSGPLDLNSLLASQDQDWNLRKAFGVNDAGEVVGLGQFKGMPQAWVMRPGGLLLHAPITWVAPGSIELRAEGAQPGATISFVDSGTRLVGTAIADQFGRASWLVQAPAGTSGRPVNIQAAEASTGRWSPPVVFRQP